MITGTQRLLGLDPGLRRTGWGIIDVTDNHCRHVANGTVTSRADDPLAERLKQIHEGLMAVIAQHRPTAAAVEETFVNKNPSSTLKLGQVRGVVMLAASLSGLPVAEYAPNAIKKAVVGTGHAAKEQIHAMVCVLLPGIAIDGADAADALAAAICHAHHAATHTRIAAMTASGWPA
jgi:crossover junction endodeoxyribonuclease RuvC